MEPLGRTWHVARNAPMRADAESIFIEAAALPDAAIGDRVTITSHDDAPERTGTVVATTAHDEQSFVRIQLDE